MRRQVIANQQGILATEIVDPSTMGHPFLLIGPAYKRHTVNLAVRMPGEEVAYQIPTPFGFDPDTIRFQPQMIIAMVPLPPGATMLINRASSSRGQIRVSQTELHAWDQQEEYGLRRGVPLHSPKLQPGDWLELQCTSRCYRPREVFDITPRPNSLQQIPWMGALVIKATWMPTEIGDDVATINGDPLDYLQVSAPAPAPSMTPLDAEALLRPGAILKPDS